MSNNSIETACQKIYRDYPEFRGVSPKISSQPAGRTLLLFQTSGRTANGKAIARTLRVVIDANGRILKASTSR